MTDAQAIALTEARIGSREITNIEAEEVEAWLTSARQRFAREKFEAADFKDYQREETLTLGVDGSVALPADVLPDSVSRLTHTSDTKPFVQVESREDMDYQACSEYGIFCVENRKIYTRAKTGEVADPLTGDVLVTDVFIPTLGSILAKDEGHFIDCCVELAQERWKFNPVGRDAKKRLGGEA